VWKKLGEIMQTDFEKLYYAVASLKHQAKLVQAVIEKLDFKDSAYNEYFENIVKAGQSFADEINVLDNRVNRDIRG
jgi:hypothetical protein